MAWADPKVPKAASWRHLSDGYRVRFVEAPQRLPSACAESRKKNMIRPPNESRRACQQHFAMILCVGSNLIPHIVPELRSHPIAEPGAHANVAGQQ